MDKQTRMAWIERGKPDPVVAYRQHAVRSAQRGIPFELTFAEWWSYWEPHYAERGKGIGCKCMCRTGDKGGYTVGNVRIATVQENIYERTLEARCRNATIRKPNERHQRNHAADSGSWLWRGNVFRPYEENED